MSEKVIRKRLGDRQAQQNLRTKRSQHIAKLEEQVARCREHHEDQGVPRLLQVIKGLRTQNEALRQRQERLRYLVDCWDADSPELTVDSPIPTSTGQQGQRPRQVHSSPTDSPAAHIGLSWKQVPLNNDDFSTLARSPVPDLLYGTKTNHLAEMIHKATQRRPVRDPECLAMGWLCYHVARWIMSPSPTTFAKLPRFLHPVRDQYQVPHPIRWPWGENILERNADNELCIKKRFYDTFMSEEGWGLTPEFIQRYPQLLVGVDVATVAYDLGES
ncbi:hypothetical protein BBP40_000449 [Aspergillus hancockii]|nr:hypothetical protein BBP40_000449 [Aspergillus hancockii]